MSAREWQPGDVASVLCSDGRWRTALHYLYMGRWTWAFGDSTFRDADTSEARRLVSIDPEDRDAARRLLETYGRQFTNWTPELDSNVTRLQAALREFANPTPPKPDEPTADAALVECDYDGKHGRAVLLGGSWTFYGDCLRDSGAMYDDFENVVVLSEGVTEC